MWIPSSTVSSRWLVGTGKDVELPTNNSLNLEEVWETLLTL
jgi:hypothetical protein